MSSMFAVGARVWGKEERCADVITRTNVCEGLYPDSCDKTVNVKSKMGGPVYMLDLHAERADLFLRLANPWLLPK